MKKSIISLLFLLAVCTFSTNAVFAQSTAGTPIIGVPVGLEHDPEGIIIARATTDVNGKFACKLPEGNYKLVLSYDQIKRILSAKDKNYASNPKGCKIELIFEGETANIKAPVRVPINKETDPINISVAKGGGTLRGTLTYTANIIVITNTKK